MSPSVGIPRKYLGCLSVALGISFPIVVCYFQFGIAFLIWSKYGEEVDRETCTCSCWDTAFKGSYEVGGNRYHHFYFNVTWNTLAIWALTVVSVVACYEGVKYTCNLIWEGRVRWPLLGVLLGSVYPHMYSWWGFLNYLNDDFYDQWMHQSLFTVTELVSTCLAVSQLDSRSPLSSTKILLILVVSLFHILAGSLDQFLSNLLLAEGEIHQVLRDIGLMIPDLLNVFFCVLLLREFARSHSQRFSSPLHAINDSDFCTGFFGLAFLLCLSRLL